MSGLSLHEPASAFDTHTAVLDDPPNSWSAHIDPELSGFGGTHGGYVAAIALRAMARVVDDPERLPRSLSLQLLAPIKPGAVELTPRLERSGSSMSAAAMEIAQDAQTAGNARALFGSRRASLHYLGAEIPDVPPPDQCRPLIDKPAPEARMGLLIEHRPAAPPLPLTGSDRAEVLVWMRLVEERALDALLLAMLVDAAPPALFSHLTSFVPMPTVEITAHFGALEAVAESPWVLGVFRTSQAREGYAVEDGQLWTPGGQLALQARQLRRILDASPEKQAPAER